MARSRSIAAILGVLVIPLGAACGGALEPARLSWIDPAVQVSGVMRVHFGRLSVDPAHSFTPATSACQDVLVLVREGAFTLDRRNGGVSPTSPSQRRQRTRVLRVGDAARFTVSDRIVLRNTGQTTAEALVVLARAAAEDSCNPEERRELETRIVSRTAVPLLLVAGGKMDVRILLDEAGQGSRHAAISLLRGAPGLHVPLHDHPFSDEIVLIEKGEGAMRLGNRELRLSAPMLVYIPEGVPHDVRNTGSVPLEAIQVYAPAGPERRFREMAESGQASQ